MIPYRPGQVANNTYYIAIAIFFQNFEPPANYPYVTRERDVVRVWLECGESVVRVW